PYREHAEFRLAEIAFLTGEVEAPTRLEAFLDNHPESSLHQFVEPYLGRYYLTQKMFSKAKPHFQTVIKEYPQSPLLQESRLGLGYILEEEGELTLASKLYQEVLSADSGVGQAEALLRSGVIAYKQGKYHQAIADLEQLQSTYEDHGDLAYRAYWLASAKIELGEYQKAQGIIESVPEDYLSSTAPSLAILRAFVLEKQTRIPAAILAYAKVYEKWPNTQWGESSLHKKIELELEQNELSAALADTKEFTKAYPNSPRLDEVERLAGKIHLKSGDYTEAGNLFSSLVENEQTEKVNGSLESQASSLQVATTQTVVDQTNMEGVDQSRDEIVTEIDDISPLYDSYHLAIAQIGAGQYHEALATLGDVDYSKAGEEIVTAVALLKATACVELKQFQEAITPLKDHLARATDFHEREKSTEQLLVCYAQADDWKATEKLYGQYRSTYPEAKEVWDLTQFLAEKAYQNEEIRFAATLYRILSNEAPTKGQRSRGLAGLAWAEIKQDEVVASSETFKRLLTQYPNSPLASTAAWTRGQLLTSEGKSYGALEMYELIINDYPESLQAPNALLAIAKIKANQQKWIEAVADYEKFKTTYPTHESWAKAYYELAWLYYDMGEVVKASEHFQILYQKKEENPFWHDATYRLAEEAVNNGEGLRARKLLTELLAEKTEAVVYAHALYLQGQLSANEKKWEEVETSLTRLLADYPETPLLLPAKYWIAEAHYRRENYENAGRLFDELMILAQGKTDSWLGVILLRKAQIKAQQKDWLTAETIASSIEEKYPQFNQIYEVNYLLGRCCASQARFNEARQNYEKTIASPTGSHTETAAMAQWMIGETHFHQKNHHEAIKAYFRVEQLYPYPRWQAAALLQAGKCYEQLSQAKESLEIYRKIVEQYPSTTFAGEARRRLTVAQRTLRIQ
ncbi:MAG: tetratricopeptide repeat protein, partial [Pirellulaceae bacterium]|nr:tetratricopeptide repeat protein [Pirellulaceae bacterium]